MLKVCLILERERERENLFFPLNPNKYILINLTYTTLTKHIISNGKLLI